jgi:hypothetical protein
MPSDRSGIVAMKYGFAVVNPSPKRLLEPATIDREA